MAVPADSTPAPASPPAPQSRKVIEQEIERLIELLDNADGEPDLEDNADDEPSIGGAYYLGLGRGRPDYDLELDEADDEPSLGAPETTVHVPGPIFWPGRSAEGSQTHWAKGWGDDDEAVNEDGSDDDNDGNILIEGGGSGRL